MAVEQFLRFWSQYNALIIELLIAAILLIVVYLAYRTFFGEEESHSLVEGKSLDVDGIEKALQKILAQQTSFVAAGPSAPLASVPAMAAAPAAVTSGAAPANTAELAKLKADIVERDRTIEDLRAQLAAAKSATASAPAPAAGSPEDTEERRKQEAYLKNLEARLAEYEIISEDIADLSFYKEEKSKLQKEIESLRSGADVPAPVEAEPIDELAAVVAELNIGNGVADEPAPAPEPEVVAEVAPDVQFEEPPVVAEAPAEPAETEEALREMAEISSSTPSQVGAPKTGTEEVALIDQFEDFVKKGS